MKRINFAGVSLVTGNNVAAALLRFATQLRAAVAVEIPVLQDNGSVAVHSLLIGPSSQLDIHEVDGLPQGQEARLFAVPRFLYSARAVPTPVESSQELAPAFDDEVWGEQGETAR